MGLYPQTLFNIVLIEPEIPQNTGNIGRTCVGCWSHLHLVGKLGFEISDRALKRAGLDYWPHLEFTHHPTWEDWWQQIPDPQRVFFLSKKQISRTLYDIEFQAGDWFVFGRETKGLDDDLLLKFSSQCATIPFPGKIRSFNLANAVAMVLGEGLRQLSGPEGFGSGHKL